jgi:hypothetical protein
MRHSLGFKESILKKVLPPENRSAAGVSVRSGEDITEVLWGSKVSPSRVSKLNQEIYERIEKWRNCHVGATRL